MSKDKLQKNSLMDLVDYQEGTIVSKTLLEKDNGTVTLFAFGEGESISEHTASHDAMAQVLEGTVEFIISGEKYKLNTGEMIIMPGGEPHSLQAVSRSKMLLTMID